MKVLITGAAGFVGMHLSRKILDLGHNVIGYDIINDYYDTQLKHDRLSVLNNYDHFTFCEGDLATRNMVNKCFENEEIDVVINLAAQAGVRYSLENPHAYVDSNLVGFVNILEACRHFESESACHHPNFVDYYN